MKIEDKLLACIEDPMWADHAEVLKRTLVEARNTIKNLQQDAERFRMLARMAAEIGPTDDDLGPLGIAAGDMAEAIEEEFGREYSIAHTGEMLTIMLDRMIEKFGTSETN